MLQLTAINNNSLTVMRRTSEDHTNHYTENMTHYELKMNRLTKQLKSLLTSNWDKKYNNFYFYFLI